MAKGGTNSMDKGAQMTYTMIEIAIDKSIRDIEDNTQRGIRNLIDLGSHLSPDGFQQDFFRVTQQLLTNDHSPLYELTRKIVRYVDHELLRNTVVKLGYTCFTYGARLIRNYERENGFNVPWTVVFNFHRVPDNVLSQAEVSEVIKQGESIGIYCGIFFVNGDQQYLASLLDGLAAHKEGAFIIFTEPEAINPSIAQKVLDIKNIILVLHLPTTGNKSTYHKAAEVLYENKCLFGTYSEYSDDNVQFLVSDHCLNFILENHSFCYFIVRKDLKNPQNLSLITDYMTTAKTAARFPLIIIDFYAELARVDRTISVEDCFLAIRGDGRIAVKNMDNIQPQLNIRTHSLETILAKTMPKINY